MHPSLQKSRLLILFCFFISSAAWSQTRGTVYSMSTKEPLSQVIIRANGQQIKSDEHGNFRLEKSAKELDFYKLGYESFTLTDNTSDTLSIYLIEKYKVLAEVNLADDITIIMNLLDKVRDSLTINYISTEVPLEYSYSTAHLSPTGDTNFSFSKNIALYNKQSRKSTLEYKTYYLDDVHHYKKAPKFNLDFKYLPLGFFLLREGISLERLIPKKIGKDKIAKINYTEIDGEEYANILIYDTDSNTVKAGPMVRSIVNNPRLFELQYLKVILYKIKTSNSALVNYQYYFLSASNVDFEELQKAQNREAMDLWLQQNLSSNKLYLWNMIEFEKDPVSKKYLAKSRYLKDNLLFLNFTKNFEPVGTYYEDYRYLAHLKNWSPTKREYAHIYDYIQSVK